MGILEKIRTAISPEARMLEQLAHTAGNLELLASQLSRHAEACSSPSMRKKLEELAAAENLQAKVLREILLERHIWPTRASRPAHDGSSNWERLNRDLALQVATHRDLNLQIAECEPLEPALAESLREMAAAEDRNIAILRDLALRCDAQALD